MPTSEASCWTDTTMAWVARVGARPGCWACAEGRPAAAVTAAAMVRRAKCKDGSGLGFGGVGTG